MRVTGGSLRGRALAAPADLRVRPTADRVREAIFNILMHNDFGTGFALAGARVIDLFAGTGAMGIEALSRGASARHRRSTDTDFDGSSRCQNCGPCSHRAA